jgi:hypothetical protein
MPRAPIELEVSVPRNAAASLLVLATIVFCAPPTVNAQPPAPVSRPPTLDDKIEAGDEELPEPARPLIKWNQYQGDFITFRVGGGLLYEYAAYVQDAASKGQFRLVPAPKLRDARLLFKGGFNFKRPVTWSTGLLFDQATHTFLFRETGVMIAVPRAWGHVFVGRTKEGFSQNKVMVGYAGWTLERAPISDATIPILADGVKWLGHAPKQHLLWNLGVYGDHFSEGQTFSTYDRQIAGRIAFVPLLSEETGRVSVLPRRQRSRVVARNRRDPRLQHPRRVLRTDFAGTSRVSGWTRRLGVRRRGLVHRSRERCAARRNLLARHAARELAPLRQHAAGIRVRLWIAGSLRERRQDAVLPEPDSAGALTASSSFFETTGPSRPALDL